MKAFLIDPKAQSITEVDYSGDHHDIYRLIDASTFDVVRLYRTGDGAYIDDEGLFKDEQHFWLHCNYPQPLAGRGLVLGVDEDGETVSPSVTLEQLREEVFFAVPEEVMAMQALLEILGETR